MFRFIIEMLAMYLDVPLTRKASTLTFAATLT